MDQLVQFFEKLVTQFTWRRLGFVLVVIFLAMIGATFYEIYTGHFRLGRIERAAQVLARLSEQSEQINKVQNEDIQKIHRSLLSDLAGYVSSEGEQNRVPAWLWKAGAAAAPWFVLALYGNVYFTIESRRLSFNFGILILVLPISFIGAVLPDFLQLWGNYLVYPVVAISVAMLALQLPLSNGSDK